MSNDFAALDTPLDDHFPFALVSCFCSTCLVIPIFLLQHLLTNDAHGLGSFLGVAWTSMDGRIWNWKGIWSGALQSGFSEILECEVASVLLLCSLPVRSRSNGPKDRLSSRS